MLAMGVSTLREIGYERRDYYLPSAWSRAKASCGTGTHLGGDSSLLVWDSRITSVGWVWIL